ncbi:MAG: hypothetical protein IT428_17770 [Planctomycetaceae bacterium]|nr:hypothetical protein [Planctomycetaceae bacterium]
MTVSSRSPLRRIVASLMLVAAALLGSVMVQTEARAQPGAPNTPPDKIPRGAGAGSDISSPSPPASGGATLESNKSYVMEYGIVLVVAAAALGAICKSSHRV